MKPSGLFCRRSVFKAAGESHSLPKMRAIPRASPSRRLDRRIQPFLGGARHQLCVLAP